MKTKLLIISVFILGAFASCERYLETNPKDFTSPENYFNTAQELNSALTGVYDALGQDGTFGRNLVIELAHGSDEGFYKRDGISLNASLNCTNVSNVSVSAIVPSQSKNIASISLRIELLHISL